MKYVSYFILVMLLYIVIGNLVSTKYTIPKEAIRVRVIANSNNYYDTKVKIDVKDIIEKDMYSIMKNTKNITDARNIINNNISTLSSDLSKYLNTIGYNINYDINFGYNYFPPKKYKGIDYKEGMYESLVITLG